MSACVTMLVCPFLTYRTLPLNSKIGPGDGIFFLFLIFVLINSNLTGDNDPEMVIPLYNICQVIQIF